MNLKDYKFDLRNVEAEIERTRRSTNAGIEQQAQILREMRESWARNFVVPTLNKLMARRAEIKRLIALEKHRLAAKKAKLPENIIQWFAEFSKTHPGRRIRWTNGQWIIVSYKDRHWNVNVHEARHVRGGVLKLASGKLTNARIKLFADAAERQKIGEP